MVTVTLILFRKSCEIGETDNIMGSTAHNCCSEGYPGLACRSSYQRSHRWVFVRCYRLRKGGRYPVWRLVHSTRLRCRLHAKHIRDCKPLCGTNTKQASTPGKVLRAKPKLATDAIHAEVGVALSGITAGLTIGDLFYKAHQRSVTNAHELLRVYHSVCAMLDSSNTY